MHGFFRFASMFVCTTLCIPLLTGCQENLSVDSTLKNDRQASYVQKSTEKTANDRTLSEITVLKTLAGSETQTVSGAVAGTQGNTLALQNLSTNSQDQSDFEAVTADVNLTLPQKLGFLHPAKDISTYATEYYITGTSDPNQDLLMNGSPVQYRGENGSFVVYTTLAGGDNVFKFEQGNTAKSITIKQSASYYTVSTTNVITATEPSEDYAMKGTSIYKLKCNAPSGSSVTAKINGQSVALSQNVAAQAGVSATYSAQYTIPNVSGTVDLGNVVYVLNYNGKTTSYSSGGKLYAVGLNDTMLVRVKSASATVYATNSYNSNFLTTARLGAVDAVSEYSGSMYHLSMGGWISASCVQPLTENTNINNVVSGTTFAKDSSSESFTLNGTAYPIYAAWQDASRLCVTFYRTVGINQLNIKSSDLFSAAEVSEKNGQTTITFTQKTLNGLWGYLIEYKDGHTTIYCKKKPTLSNGTQPLTGITVAIDAGHGGTDSGALGLAFTNGAMEKQINFAAAGALKKKLELLGATVFMVRSADDSLSLDERALAAQNQHPDFFISLHSNSAGYGSNALAAHGVEVYYYETTSAPLANALVSNISAQTGRTSRGAKYSNYKVTLNTYAPSVLVEMGFLLNPGEYDSLCTKTGVYNTVTAISNGILSVLR